MKRIFIYLIGFLPLVYLLIRLFIIDDVNDPIKYIYTITGASATVIIFFTITISMIKNKNEEIHLYSLSTNLFH